MTDLITISVTAGQGGRGHVSLRRTKQVTKGGPDGGNGGNGGDIIFEAREDVRDLNEFKGKPKFVAGVGGDGGKNGLDGKRGEDLGMNVPVGTIVRRAGPDGTVEADLDVTGDKVTVLGGGIGGRGNRSFGTSRNRTPILAEAGEPGETAAIEIEFRIEADIAIIGATQVGRSALLNLITNTGVEERDYAYSTAEPVIGVVILKGKDRKVVEIPGLFRAGEEKLGPGVKFLRHAEKSQLLVLMIGEEVSLNDEANRMKRIFLEHWSSLLTKQRIYVRATKKTETFEVYSGELNRLHADITRDALKAFLIGELSKIQIIRRLQPKHYDMSRLKNRERIQKEVPVVEKKDGQFVLKSAMAEMLARGTDLNTWEAEAQFKGQLKDWKLARLIEAQGIKEGDELRVGNKVVKW